MEILSDPLALLAILAALFLGGMLKGATGAGAPVVAVPVIAAVTDVRLAVALMAVTNLLSNLWQFYKFRDHLLTGRFTACLAVGGGVGAVIGTVALAQLHVDALQVVMAVAILAYIALRLAKPDMHLSQRHAGRIVLPVSLTAGVLQGAAGISAPISVSFLNAMRLERPMFIATISIFFTGMNVVQVPTLYFYGLLDWYVALLGLLALVMLLIGMPAGDWLARRMSAKAFDRIMLAFLAVLAVRLLWSALT